MVKAAHAVVGVDKAGGAGVHGGKRLLVGGIGVADGGHDALGVERGDVGLGAVTLGGQGALDDAAAGLLLPALEDLVAGIDEVLGVLGAHVLHREERALEVDALDVRAAEARVAGVVGCGDGGAALADVLDTVGERRGHPRGGATTGELDARGVHAVGIGVDRGVSKESVDVRVHHARRDPAARVVADLHALGRLGAPRAERAIAHGEEATIDGRARQEEPVGLDRIRCHVCPLSNAGSPARDGAIRRTRRTTCHPPRGHPRGDCRSIHSI